MRKIMLLAVLITLIMSSINVFAINPDKNIQITEENENINFSEATITTEGEYINLKIAETQNMITSAGCPMLPVYKKELIFPLGTKILEVECIPQDLFEKEIDSKVKIASKLVPKIKLNKLSITDNDILDSYELKDFYTQSDFYPTNWYDYKISTGLKNGVRVLYLTMSIYPVRYMPSEDKIIQAKNFDLNIKYETPKSIFKTFDEEFDMVIITPSLFSDLLTDFVAHKNKYGIKTFVKTTEEIYNSYSGIDKAEKIKYFIKDAIETWNITYVLLMGGRYEQTLEWYLPSRYSNLEVDREEKVWDPVFLSDLYFADVYRYNESSAQYEFCSWDSDGDGLFAEWPYHEKPIDIVDFYPDVYVGRLPCRKISEVKVILDKIIEYERETYGSLWFKKMILIGGDTFPYNNPYFEGELETALGGSYVEPLGFSLVKIWASNLELSRQSDVVEAINEDGAGFLYFSGHANPMAWSTHPANDESWIDGLYNWAMYFLRNVHKYPVCVVGGCHNSQFDVTLANIKKGIDAQGVDYFSSDVTEDSGAFWKAEWSPHCWSWNLVRQKNAGAIACIGNTGLGYGGDNLSCTEVADGWIASHFFKVYAEQSVIGNHNLGMIHSQTIIDYINWFTSGSSDDTWDYQDGKTVEGWVLIGDPSLRIGGYPPSS